MNTQATATEKAAAAAQDAFAQLAAARAALADAVLQASNATMGFVASDEVQMNLCDMQEALEEAHMLVTDAMEQQINF